MSRRELDLDAALADLATALEFHPPRPGRRRHRPAGAGPARSPGAGSPGPALRWPAGWRRLAAVGLAAVLLAAAVLVASPGPGRRWPGAWGCAGSASRSADPRRRP